MSSCRSAGLGCDVLNNVDMVVHAGEIVGIAGITGSGRDEVATALFGGIDRAGEVTINGAAVPKLRPDRAMAMGMGLVPAERHANAAFMTSTLRENITVVGTSQHWHKGILSKSRERSDVAVWLERLDVRPRNSEFTMADLSGGNQQKVVLARWLRMGPKVLILNEPTQGVDVGAKSDIHKLIDEAAADGHRRARRLHRPRGTRPAVPSGAGPAAREDRRRDLRWPDGPRSDHRGHDRP